MNKSDYNDVTSSVKLCLQAIEDTKDIYEMLSNNNEYMLPTWWTNKLAVSAAYLNSLRDYAVYTTSSKEDNEKDDEEYEEAGTSENLEIGSYTTQHFDICPAAINLYADITNKTDMIHLAVESAMLHDIFFKLEKQAIAMGVINKEDLDKATQYAIMIMNLASEMNLIEEHSYIYDVHIPKIKEFIQDIDYSMVPPSARSSYNAY